MYCSGSRTCIDRVACCTCSRLSVHRKVRCARFRRLPLLAGPILPGWPWPTYTNVQCGLNISTHTPADDNIPSREVECMSKRRRRMCSGGIIRIRRWFLKRQSNEPNNAGWSCSCNIAPGFEMFSSWIVMRDLHSADVMGRVMRYSLINITSKC